MVEDFIGRVKSFWETHPEKRALLTTLFLLVALPLLVLAAVTVQNIRQRASAPIEILHVSGNQISKTSDTDVLVKINLPSDWRLPEGALGRNSSNKDVVRKAYAQSTGAVSGFVRYPSGGGPAGLKVYIFAGSQYFQDITL